MSYGLAVSADELKRFRDAIRAMVGSDLPGCINPRDYANARRTALPEMWSHNPARAFLRLTDADQRKVLQYLGGDNA